VPADEREGLKWALTVTIIPAQKLHRGITRDFPRADAATAGRLSPRRLYSIVGWIHMEHKRVQSRHTQLIARSVWLPRTPPG
jgi:hypothetical protein